MRYTFFCTLQLLLAIAFCPIWLVFKALDYLCDRACDVLMWLDEQGRR